MKHNNEEKKKKYICICLFFFFILNVCQLMKGQKINLKYLQESKNETSPFNVETDFGTCSVIHCGNEVCAVGPNAQCSASNTTNNRLNYQCNCNQGYITYKKNEVFQCCYQQKNAITALLIEFFLGFGAGHFYIGNIFIGSLKAVVYSIFYLSGSIILVKIIKQNENEGRPFLLKFTSSICLMLCSCTYIIWQIVDSILFSIGGYTDGNGANLYISA